MQFLVQALLWRGTLITLVAILTIACTVLARAIGDWLRLRRTKRSAIAAAQPEENREPSYLSATDGPRPRRALPRSAGKRNSTENGKSREAA